MIHCNSEFRAYALISVIVIIIITSIPYRLRLNKEVWPGL